MTRSELVSPETFNTFGDLLIYLRKRAHLTQEELGRAVGYSRAHITRLEKKQRLPDFTTVAATFLTALDLHTDTDWAARLLQLASQAHHSAGSMTLTHTRQHEVITAEVIEESSLLKEPHTNLPSQLTRFIGREKEMAEVTDLISGQRLITLTGTGGTGKTRLLLQLADGLLNEFEDGLWWIDLLPLSDPERVSHTIASTLSLREEPDRSIGAILIDHLRAKHCLLILDNCEHLIEVCTALVTKLLQNCPRLHIAATSRERLSVAGETIYPVPPLTKPDSTSTRSTVDDLAQYEAVRLFEARAVDVLASFKLTEKNGQAVAQICDRLDGLPLAIELAAARVNVLRVEDIAARLTDRFQLLTGGRSLPPRHQTLLAAIDWSYDLLSPAEQIFFQRCAVFAGSWTLPAAEMICTGTGLETSQGLDLLQHLINKSLIISQSRGDERRFRLLETIREYAADKLIESGDSDRVRTRHLDFYMQLAEEAYLKIFGAEQVVWLDRLETEYPDLRAALEWSDASGNTLAGLRMAGALSYFWYIRVQLSEARTWLTRALSASTVRGREMDAARARALLWLGSLDRFDAAVARHRLEESLQLFEALDDRNGQAVAFIRLGGMAAQEAKYAEARSLVEQGLPMLQAAGNTSGLALAFNLLGEIARANDDDQSAQVFYVEALALAKEVGDVWRCMAMAQNLGFVAIHQGRYAEARECLQEAIRLGRLTKDPAIDIVCSVGFAGMLAATGRTAQAVRLLSAAESKQVELQGHLDDADNIDYERTLSLARANLEPGAFAIAWDEGRTLALDRAISDALELTKWLAK